MGTKCTRVGFISIIRKKFFTNEQEIAGILSQGHDGIPITRGFQDVTGQFQDKSCRLSFPCSFGPGYLLRYLSTWSVLWVCDCFVWCHQAKLKSLGVSSAFKYFHWKCKNLEMINDLSETWRNQEQSDEWVFPKISLLQTGQYSVKNRRSITDGASTEVISNHRLTKITTSFNMAKR